MKQKQNWSYLVIAAAIMGVALIITNWQNVNLQRELESSHNAELAGAAQAKQEITECLKEVEQRYKPMFDKDFSETGGANLNKLNMLRDSDRKTCELR